MSEKVDHISNRLRDDLEIRIEEIEYFIMKKKKDDPAHPTVFDLANMKIEKLDSELKESVAQLNLHVDQLGAKDEIADYRI